MSLQHLFPVRLWNAAAVGAAGTLTSPILDQSLMERLESLELKATSVAGAADVKVEYAEVDDDGNVSGFDSNPPIIVSTAAQTNPEQMHALPLPNPLSRRFKIRVTEISAGALSDTLVTANLVCREWVG